VKVSVVIPTYNSAKTIRATLDSVFAQTYRADEILVYDDGSIDETISILRSYDESLKIFQGVHQGVANVRNALCALAKGNYIAFLDHDDLWHPTYLEVQTNLFRKHPQAVASFTGHLNFFGYGDYVWAGRPNELEGATRIIEPLEFFEWYNRATGPFSSMSYCCIPKATLERMGDQPFMVSGVDDSYLCYVLALLGPVVYKAEALVAYRVTHEAQSNNKLEAYGRWVEVFHILQDRYKKQPDARLYRAFKKAFASKRRQYAKSLMGIARKAEARRELCRSLRTDSHAFSIFKSLTLLFLTGMPRILQPQWLPKYREVTRIH